MQEKNDAISSNKIDVNINTEGLSDGIILSRGKRSWVCIFFLVMNVVCNMDNGFFPPATAEIRRDFKIDDGLLGMFGSVVFLGNLLGGLIITPIINKFNRKYMLIFFLCINAVALYTFTLYMNVVWGIINRIIVGITQVRYF
jgi:predicted MFS family arabinose efflux permease